MRDLIFGLEDSLVSTLGTITGIAIGAQNTYIVILSGLVLIAAESTSMAAGSFLSNRSAIEAENKQNHNTNKHAQHPIRGSVVMFVSYILGGFIPLSPYFFLSPKQAIPPSIIMTIITLFFVGFWSAKYTGRSRVKSGVEMMVISLSAALIGYGIGYWLNVTYHVNI